MQSKKIILIIFTLAFTLLANGCIYITRDVTVEARFHETKEPVSGSLSCVYPIIAWPQPPCFEIKTGEGSYDIKLVNDFIGCYFKLPDHGEYDSDYTFEIDMDDKNTIKWTDPLISDWKMMRLPNNPELWSKANYPQLEYRVILPE